MDTFPENPRTALAIVACESGFNPNAHNASNKNGTVDSGLFQINSIHHTRMEELGLDVWKPQDNIKFARMLYDESGFAPWVCYTHGMLSMI